MALEREQATYERELPTLLDRLGKFAVISGDTIAGVYDTFEDALQVGYDRFGLNPFAVHQIELEPQVARITRLMFPCPI
jgi:hypothetical protein